MNPVSMKPWRRVQDKDLHRWAGGGLLARAERIVKAGRVHEMTCSVHGEAFATVVSADGKRSQFAGVLLEFDGKRPVICCSCSCQRRPCEHAVAVAIALRAAVRGRRTPARMQGLDARLQSLPQPQSESFDLEFEEWAQEQVDHMRERPANDIPF